MLLINIENQKCKMLNNLVRHDKLRKTTVAKKVEGKRGPERLRRTFLNQINEKADVMSFKVKTLAEERQA